MNCLFRPLTVAGLYHGDSRDVLRTLPDNSIDSVVTDPPYALVSIVKRFGGENAAPAKVGASGAYARASAGFMGAQWDTGEVAFAAEFWSEVYRVLKPGGHVVSFGGTRTYHRMVCAIEDAGFEIRDQLQWLYGTGFPKSHDVSKAIDAQILHGSSNPRSIKKAIADRPGESRKTSSLPNNGIMSEDRRVSFTNDNAATPEAEQWEGWGTALKPANEPICLARKPLSEKTVALNVLKWGTGALNIDACRIATDDNLNGGAYSEGGSRSTLAGDSRQGASAGMYQAGKTAEKPFNQPSGRFPANVITDGSVTMPNGAQRFFYSAKASKADRGEGNNHPTVKPTELMQYLCRLVTPPGGTVLDPFMGSGSTGKAARLEGFQFVGIEREEAYFKIAQGRCA